MNLVLLNTFDGLGGAAIATYRLHRGLRSAGINSHLLVQRKITDDPTVIGPTTKFQKAIALVRPILDGIATGFYRKREKKYFSPAFLPDRLASRVSAFAPDIIHLFWVNSGFMRAGTLSQFKRPIVWTLHDMWPFTGGCHYDDECGRFQGSCGKCPALHSESDRDLSRLIWELKRNSWDGIPIVIVATSQWLADMARLSSLFRSNRIEVIPNGIDTDKYKPLDKMAARLAYNLPRDKHLVLFSAFGATTEKRKGNHFLVQALERMAQCGWAKGTELVIIGASEPEYPQNLGMPVHYMSHLLDEVSQVLLYSAVDITVAPSMQENLSNVVMESLACGTPVAAFHVGGMPDLIEHKINGYLATPFESNDLADGIMWVLENKDRRDMLSRNARSVVEERYTLKKVSEQYLALYLEMTATK